MNKHFVSGCFPALLWTAPELMASQRAGALGLSTGTQKGDVYSFAIILHEILYRAGLYRCVENDEPIPPKSKSVNVIETKRCTRYLIVNTFNNSPVRERGMAILRKV